MTQILKLLNLKLITESKLIRKRIFLVKVTLIISQEKYLLLILLLKLILGLSTERFKRRKNDKFLWKRTVVEYIINDLLSTTR